MAAVLIAACVAAWLMPIGGTAASVVVHHFDVSYGDASPDNYLQRGAILINGQFPGPTIRAKSYDTLVVYVTNSLDHNFAMHWHGLLQRTTKSSDGVANITQQPIEVGQTYKYRIELNGQHGTYAYHAHVRLDVVWAHGVLIIDDRDLLALSPVYDYKDDRVITVSQCWHTDIDQLITMIPRLPRPDSILINGRSFGEWSVPTLTFPPTDSVGYHVVRVKPNRVYRFRFVAFTDDSAVTCSIGGHIMTIIETDGTLTDPVPVSHLQLNVLQRYSVLVRTDQSVGNYLISCALAPLGGPDNGVAILHYKGAPDPTPLRTVERSGSSGRQPMDQWVLSQLRPSTILPFQRMVYRLPRLVDQELIIETQVQRTANGRTRFMVNGQNFVFPEINLLDQISSGIDIGVYDSVYTLEAGQAVQMVFQNQVTPEGDCIQHPWHMHGHTFYVVGYGPDRYDPISAGYIIERNIDRGEYEFRDVTTLFPNRTGADPGYCGWTAIRFVANNPGVWLVHCHITPHMLLGKVFAVYTKDFSCRSRGLQRDPSDCSQYYRCVRFIDRYHRYKYTCPVGMYYDDIYESCNYPWLVDDCRGDKYDGIYSREQLIHLKRRDVKRQFNLI